MLREGKKDCCVVTDLLFLNTPSKMLRKQSERWLCSNAAQYNIPTDVDSTNILKD